MSNPAHNNIFKKTFFGFSIFVIVLISISFLFSQNYALAQGAPVRDGVVIPADRDADGIPDSSDPNPDVASADATGAPVEDRSIQDAIGGGSVAGGGGGTADDSGDGSGKGSSAGANDTTGSSASNPQAPSQGSGSILSDATKSAQVEMAKSETLAAKFASNIGRWLGNQVLAIASGVTGIGGFFLEFATKKLVFGMGTLINSQFGTAIDTAWRIVTLHLYLDLST